MAVKKISGIMETIENIKGVLSVKRLGDEDIKNLATIESQRDKDIIPVINEGLKECLKRDVCFVIFKDERFRIPPKPTVLLLRGDGEIIGQEIISTEEREKFKADENILFLSNDFVLFKDHAQNKGAYPGKEYFLLPPVDFPELNNMANIVDIVSSSPSTPSDDYLKNKYGNQGNPKIATIILGFSLK